jgi:hypothetical protein
VPLYAYNGQLFQVGGELAANQNCCCEPGGCAIDCECLASTYTLSYPAITFGYNGCTEGVCGIVTATAPAQTVTLYRCCETYYPCGDPPVTGVLYRSNPVPLDDIELCCVDGFFGDECATVPAWIIYAMGGGCVPECETPNAFSGWLVSAVVVIGRLNADCEVCNDPTPRDISGDGCLGYEFPADWVGTLFTGSGTCPTDPQVVVTELGSPPSSSYYNPSDPSDPCDPTGTYSVCDTDTSPPCTLTATVS